MRGIEKDDTLCCELVVLSVVCTAIRKIPKEKKKKWIFVFCYFVFKNKKNLEVIRIHTTYTFTCVSVFGADNVWRPFGVPKTDPTPVASQYIYSFFQK